jgi:hypothetical protein
MSLSASERLTARAKDLASIQRPHFANRHTVDFLQPRKTQDIAG